MPDMGGGTVDSSYDTISAELNLVYFAADDVIVPLVADLHYASTDPYAVRLAFHVGTDEPVEWVFSRELLSEGLKARVGAGDVRTWPSSGVTPRPEAEALPGGDITASPDVFNIEIWSTERAHLQAPALAIARFLQRTNELVPPGEEASAVDIDAELDAFVWQA